MCLAESALRLSGREEYLHPSHLKEPCRGEAFCLLSLYKERGRELYLLLQMSPCLVFLRAHPIFCKGFLTRTIGVGPPKGFSFKQLFPEGLPDKILESVKSLLLGAGFC